jgi:GntR family transcriptional regulator
MRQGRVVSLQSEKDTSQPLYLQVEATLREMIEDVEFGPGDQIPSERELSEMLGVSRMTVRRAIENLIRTGVLERRSTNGTYVRLPQVVRPMGPQPTLSISQMLEGKESTAKLLHFETVRAPRKVAARLQLRVGEQVIMLKRLRSVNGLPFCVETTYIPAALVPGLTAEDLSNNISFYQLLKLRFGVTPIEGDAEIKMAYCLAEEAQLLGLDEGAPVLFMKSTVCDIQGKPVEYLKSVNHPDRVVFRMQSNHQIT